MKIVIIGNGIAGTTAARWVRKLDAAAEITLVSDETDYFFSRTALMYIYMGHMRRQDTQPYENDFWGKNRIQLCRGRVQRVDFQAKTLHLTNAGETLPYDKLVLATGSRSNKFGWPGQDLDGVHGLYSMQDLDAMERHTAAGIGRAVVAGGGLIGIEMAEMFHSRRIPVTLLVREDSFWNSALPAQESAMVNRHILAHGIDLRLSSELDQILDENKDGKADAVVLKSGERIECQFVGLTVGVSPNVDFLKTDAALRINKGILVNNYLETSVPDVYAIGDCAELETPQPGRRATEAIWYTGKMMGETVAYNITGSRVAYDPGIWFNSAKFLDIEYQVYGDIRVPLPEQQEALYWEHPDGEKSVRIHFDKKSQAVAGFQVMGIRYRQEVCERWIKEKTHIETVLQHLGLANFDPELYREYEMDVVRTYNQQFQKNIPLQTRRGLNAVTRFLKKMTG
ncbi:MAG TPA: FAD/NAD(P)-binding oxidoreductase [Saprospiraceae bacterium]|nr:FAD/NAD(P)-binding oxidoreductase [Saprospiraceae bacterium]HPI08794.1 FAD/NAD(P)-binding oxidoreductase [Saprospiraceae bacterium]